MTTPAPRLPAHLDDEVVVLDTDRLQELFEATLDSGEPPRELLDHAIRCSLEEEIEPTGGIVLMRSGGRLSAEYPAWCDGTTLYLLVPFDAGEGYVHLDGHAPVDVAWTTDGVDLVCAPTTIEPAEESTLVRGVVRDAAGEPEDGLWVDGCGGNAITDDRGAYEIHALPGPCTLRAFRQDGEFATPGDPVAVELEPGEDATVDLTVPDRPQAGMGAVIRLTDDGAVIDEVIEGGGAHDEGLRPGDLVLEIAGASTADMTFEELVAELVGRVGTEVDLTIRREGQDLEFTIVRRALNRRE